MHDSISTAFPCFSVFWVVHLLAFNANANMNPADNASNVTSKDGGPWLRTGITSLAEIGFAYANYGSPSNRSSGRATTDFQQINFTIAAGSFAPFDFITNASCVELNVVSTGPVAVYVLSWENFRNNYDFAGDYYSGTNNSRLFEPETYFADVTDISLIANTNLSEAYAPVVMNNGSSTTYALVNFTGYAEGNPKCKTVLKSAVQFVTEDATAAELTWSLLKANDIHHGPTFSNATCIAFALKAGGASAGFDLQFNAGTGSQPPGVDAGMIVMSETEKSRWITSGLPPLAVKSGCSISAASPSPCFVYVDNLERDQTYFTFQASGLNTPADQAAQLRSPIPLLSKTAARSAGSCQNIYPGATAGMLASIDTAPAQAPQSSGPSSSQLAALTPVGSTGGTPTQHTFGVKTVTINQLRSSSHIAALNVWILVNGQVFSSQTASLEPINQGTFDVSRQALAQLNFSASPADSVIAAFQIMSLSSLNTATDVLASGRQVIQGLSDFKGQASAWTAIQGAASRVQPAFSGCEGFLAAEKFGSESVNDLLLLTDSSRAYVSSNASTASGCTTPDFSVTCTFT